MRRASVAVCVLVTACGGPPRRFALREPLTTDTDLRPVSIACRPDPSAKDARRVTCAPREYASPFAWNQIDNVVFAPLSRLLSIDVAGEAGNANSLDEVADSAWFENRIGARTLEPAQTALGACQPEDVLPTEVADGEWLIEHGKSNGSTPGFRVMVPGKGLYMLKGDDRSQPERASAASVIGAAIYHAAGFATSCEQVVLVKRAQLKLMPGLFTTDNSGGKLPLDDKAVDAVLASSTQVGDRTRMQASKWLSGYALGPFRYEHTREDDPNDVIDHENRRELRGSRLLAAWLNHWDSREQNSMDMWLATDAKHERSSPGYVRHYILDTSEAFGGTADPHTLTIRLGFSYMVDLRDIVFDLATVGLVERAWDRTRTEPRREKFGFFSGRDFEPASWKGLYPNPAFVRMSERDGAWMARIIARFTPADVRAIVTAGQFSDPADVDYLTQVLVERQRRILVRYLARRSPLADVHGDADQLCAVDLARLRGVFPAERFRYTVVERGVGAPSSLVATPSPAGVVCFTPRPSAPAGLSDDDDRRAVIFEVRNGTSAGPLEIHAVDLGARGVRVVGLLRP